MAGLESFRTSCTAAAAAAAIVRASRARALPGRAPKGLSLCGAGGRRARGPRPAHCSWRRPGIESPPEVAQGGEAVSSPGCKKLPVGDFKN